MDRSSLLEKKEDLIVVRRLVTPIMNYGHALLLLRLLPVASSSTLRSNSAQSLTSSAPATSIRMCSSDESSACGREDQMQQQRMTQMSSTAMRRRIFVEHNVSTISTSAAAKRTGERLQSMMAATSWRSGAVPSIVAADSGSVDSSRTASWQRHVWR